MSYEYSLIEWLLYKEFYWVNEEELEKRGEKSVN